MCNLDSLPGSKDAASHGGMHYSSSSAAAATATAAKVGGAGGAKKPSKLAKLRRKVSNVQQLWIYPFTHYKPTNQVMDLQEPGSNEDYLAAKFRDELMPLRGWVHHHLPSLLHINKAFIQGPAFGCPGIMTYLDARTRWLDGEVQRAIREGVTQVVVVAAGYDTRAYRLSAPGVTFFEIDLPEASESKRKLVEKTLPADQFPRPTYISADLSRVSLSDALLGATCRNGPGLFDPAARTLFTVEGLVYYLPPAAVTRLFESIRQVASPGSRAAFDFLHQDVFSGRKWAPGYETLRLTVKNKGEPKRSGLDPAGVRDYLGPMGWRLSYMPKPKEVAAAMYPHRKWSKINPVIPPFYNFAVAEAV
ncbi:hypothetical protein PLESTM_000298500 [Pleodorina starrii]|nr:hypothetical protein PLESTM_000298500 [Pleodorina starrii]